MKGNQKVMIGMILVLFLGALSLYGQADSVSVNGSEPSDHAIFLLEDNFQSESYSPAVFTSEEFGRKHLQAFCSPVHRDAALTVATKHIDSANRIRM
jgi:hypothetical protein